MKSPLFLSLAGVLAGFSSYAAEIDLIRPEDEGVVENVVVPQNYAPVQFVEEDEALIVQRPVKRLARRTVYQKIQPQEVVDAGMQEELFYVPNDELEDVNEVSASVSPMPLAAPAPVTPMYGYVPVEDRGDECPIWGNGENGDCYGYGYDSRGIYSRRLALAQQAAGLSPTQKLAFYRAAVEECMALYKQNLEMEKQVLYQDNVYNNTAFASHTAAAINKCYEETGYAIINEYYNGDLRVAGAFSRKVPDFYLKASGLDFKPEFCGKHCSVDAVLTAQEAKFGQFRVYLLELIDNRARSGYRYGF